MLSREQARSVVEYVVQTVDRTLGLVERGVVALETSAEAQQEIAARLDAMHRGYIDVRVVQDHD